MVTDNFDKATRGVNTVLRAVNDLLRVRDVTLVTTA